MKNFHLQNALIFDGSGDSAFEGDILMKQGKIEKIQAGKLDTSGTYQKIDATGKWITPGFIDIHTHYDGEIEIAPGLSESVRHGITTVMMGSCGLSMVIGDPESLSDMFTRVEGLPSDYIKSILKEKKNWDTPKAYLEHLDSLNLGPNVAMFLGHSTLRSYVMGLERSLTSAEKPSQKELQKMTAILNDALDCGYLGLSINLLEFDKMDGTDFRSRPTPSVFAGWKEYRHLFKTLRQRNRVLQTVPNTANPLTFFSFMLESAALFRPKLKTSMLAMIDGKSVRGIHRIFGNAARFANKIMGADVKFQGLPEPFDVVTNGFESPFFEEFESGTAYLHLQEVNSRRALLDDPEYRRKFRKQWKQKFAPRAFQRDLNDTLILSCPDASLNGKSFRELADQHGQEEVDYFLDVVQKYGDALRWYTVVGNDRPKELNWIINHPDCHIGFSDAGAHLKNMAHYNFPLRLFKFVLEQKGLGSPTLSIEKAVYKVTKELADWFGIDAGTLETGKRADLVVIDPNNLNEELDQQVMSPMPGLPDYHRWVRRNPTAVPFVFINGEMVSKNGVPCELLGNQKIGSILKAF